MAEVVSLVYTMTLKSGKIILLMNQRQNLAEKPSNILVRVQVRPKLVLLQKQQTLTNLTIQKCFKL